MFEKYVLILYQSATFDSGPRSPIRRQEYQCRRESVAKEHCHPRHCVFLYHRRWNFDQLHERSDRNRTFVVSYLQLFHILNGSNS